MANARVYFILILEGVFFLAMENNNNYKDNNNSNNNSKNKNNNKKKKHSLSIARQTAVLNRKGGVPNLPTHGFR